MSPKESLRTAPASEFIRSCACRLEGLFALTFLASLSKPKLSLSIFLSYYGMRNNDDD